MHLSSLLSLNFDPGYSIFSSVIEYLQPLQIYFFLAIAGDNYLKVRQLSSCCHFKKRSNSSCSQFVDVVALISKLSGFEGLWRGSYLLFNVKI